jgi:dTDP-4-amino-4,6-dideoxygalactose transaminase
MSEIINSTTKRKIYLASPHMGGLEQSYIMEAFETNWIAPLGPNVDGFEKELADMVGASSSTALVSGTAGIQMALRYFGVGKEDMVFCSSLTFAATCNPILYENGIPVFIDSEPETWNMSPRALEKAVEECEKIGRLPKAVIVVNLYGQSADMDSIKLICDKFKVPIIEDAAESLGAKYKGNFSGTFGKFGIYSFNGNKIITTSGGGMIVSNDSEAIKKIHFWATQAKDNERYYQHTEVGYNFRMSNILAGIGRGQLKVLEDRVKAKKRIFEFYKKALENVPEIEFMPISKDGEPNFWLTVITLRNQSKVKPIDLILALEKENIEARHVWKPMHLQPIYKEYKFYCHEDNGQSISEDIFNRGVCLPSDTKMTEEDLCRVVNTIKSLYNN